MTHTAVFLHRQGFTAFYWMKLKDGSVRKLTKIETIRRESVMQFTPERPYPKQPKTA